MNLSRILYMAHDFRQDQGCPTLFYLSANTIIVDLFMGSMCKNQK
jgi:hypothetical protein